MTLFLLKLETIKEHKKQETTSDDPMMIPFK